MQSSDPSGKAITCVPIPDTAALQQQMAGEATVRQQADNALDARIDALEGAGVTTEAHIVGKWAVSGTTTCLQSSTGFSTQFMSPIVPGAGLPSAFVSQLTGTFTGTRTFIAGGTGVADGTTQAMTLPGTLHGTQNVIGPNGAPIIGPNGAPITVPVTGVSTNAGGASTATLNGTFTWIIQANGTLLIQDQGPLSQPFTQPPERLNWTATIESLPPFVGHISKDRRSIVMTHPDMQVETSVTRNVAGIEQNRTHRFCARHRVMTRLD
jgi:hypothetical protein